MPKDQEQILTTPRRQLFLSWLRYRYPLFIACAAVIVLANGYLSFRETSKLFRIRQFFPYKFPGLKFSGLNNILPGAETIGYYTDKNLDNKENAAQFAQAQYVLAPLVLLKGHENFEYVIFDCSNPEVALQKIAELKMLAIKQNRFGIIIARDRRLMQKRFGYKP